MNYSKEQFEKLPKWAQSEILRLEMNKRELEEKIKQFSGETETNTFIMDGLDEMPLPKNSCVRFKVGPNNSNSVSVYIRHNGEIDFNSDSRIGQSMVILPRAANQFYINFID